MSERPKFRIDENGDLIITSRFGVEFKVEEDVRGTAPGVEKSMISITTGGTLPDYARKYVAFDGGRKGVPTCHGPGIVAWRACPEPHTSDALYE